MKTDFNSRDVNFALCAAVAIAAAAMLFSLVTGRQAAAGPLPQATTMQTQKLDTIVVTAKRLPKTDR